jgi:hypothetical protein
MPHPTPDSPFPYTRSAAASLTGASASQVRKLGKSLLRKTARGITGHHVGHDFDDVLRIAVARELLRIGATVASLRSIFAAIEPDWPRLRAPNVHATGACLVLEVGHLGLNSQTCRARLTTAKEAVNRLRSTQTVIVIDIGQILIRQRSGPHNSFG